MSLARGCFLALLCMLGQTIAEPRCDKCESKRFAGKVFLVTGASSGIGEAIAKELAKDGAHVVLAARRLDKLNEIATEIKSNGGRASVEKMDVLDYDNVVKVVNSTIRTHGQLDGAFNNAGGSGTPAKFGDADLSEWKKIFELNFYGTLNCMRAELGVMVPQKRGSIVNNLSILKSKVMQTQSHYASSKRAILAVQDHAALEHASDGVRINSVSPAFTLPSESLDRFVASNPEMKPKFQSPQGRLIDAAEDVYPAVALLLDDEQSRSLNGIDIPVAGGMSLDELSL